MSPSKPPLVSVILIFAFLFTPAVASASPVMLNPTSLLAWCFVACWTMVVVVEALPSL